MGAALGAGGGTPLAKRRRSRLCRLSSGGAGFPMGNRHGGAGEKTTLAAPGIVRGNLLSCCLQTQGLPAAPTRHGPFPASPPPRGAEPLPGDEDAAGTSLAEGMMNGWVKPWDRRAQPLACLSFPSHPRQLTCISFMFMTVGEGRKVPRRCRIPSSSVMPQNWL